VPLGRVSDVSLRYDQLTTIEEYSDTRLVLRTADKCTYIFIPVELNGYAAVRGQLASWGLILSKQNQSLESK